MGTVVGTAVGTAVGTVVGTVVGTDWALMRTVLLVDEYVQTLNVKKDFALSEHYVRVRFCA